jgi:SAM-dependent methyltransferase
LPSREDIVDLSLPEVEQDDFAAIVFWHSLEHLPDSGPVMAAAAERLRPGGVVFVAVPDLGSPQARFFGDRWIHLDLPRHLVHLTTDSLIGVMEADGLKVTATSRTRGGQNLIGWLDGFVAMLPGGLNLYQALRRKTARRIHLDPVRRVLSILAGIVLFPVALVCAAAEIAGRRSGTIYVEGRRV